MVMIVCQFINSRLAKNYLILSCLSNTSVVTFKLVVERFETKFTLHPNECTKCVISPAPGNAVDTVSMPSC